MPRLFTLLGIVVLLAFSFGQYRSWSLFDEVSSASPARGAAGGGRFYHK